MEEKDVDSCSAGHPPLVLGSASPRRARILREVGCDCEILVANAPEISDDADPVGTVVRNALAKHAACRALRPDADLVTADTIVWFRGKVFGKPRDLAEAASFLRTLSGRVHTVFSAVAFSCAGDAEPAVRVEASVVRFRALTDADISAYLDLVHPLDRAGAYDISDYGGILIESTQGSDENIAGLPIDLLRPWLEARGHRNRGEKTRLEDEKTFPGKPKKTEGRKNASISPSIPL